MDSNGILLFARSVVSPAALDAFHRWYDSHIPRRLRAPGFLSCVRMQNARNPCEVIALYQIKNASFLESLLAQDLTERHPLLAELAASPPPSGVESVLTGVYALSNVHPVESEFMQSDTTISLELWDWADPLQAAALERSYDQMYLSHLLEYPDHVAAFRFKRFDNPIIEYTNRAPRNLSIIENPAGLPASQVIELRLRKDKEALLTNRMTGVYTPLSKHWQPSVPR